HDCCEREITPRGIIEQMYVHDISSIVWEILRLRRCKVVIINSAFRSALEDLLKQLLRQPGQSEYDVGDEAEALAQAWFTDQEAKKQVSEILARFDLDEYAIEAEAIRRSSSDLELLDRMLTSLESRRDKALGCVAEYRASLAHQLQESADRLIDGKGVLRLEDAGGNRPTAADQGERTANCRQPSQRAQEHWSPFQPGEETVEPQRLSPRPDVEHHLNRGICETAARPRNRQ